MPVIGISACAQLADYVESVRRAGGEPLVLEASGSAHPVESLDGLLLTGGGDVDPARYREARHQKTGELDLARDAFEMDIVRAALEANLPILGVCRGLQVLNVAAGGTLIQDIPSEVAGALHHSIDTPLYAIAHEVWLTKGSRLSAIAQDQAGESEVLHVNSRHHQAAGRVADGFSVSATAPDGVVEGIERPASRFCLAVQWHPENFWRTGEFRTLFEAFVAAAEEK